MDPDRIGIVGHCRGAMCGLIVAAEDSRVKCVVSIEPSIEPDRIHEAVAKYSPIFFNAVLNPILEAAPEGAPPLVAATGYADRIKVPVYLIGGLFDLVCPPHYQAAMAKALNESGNEDAEFELLPIGHFFEQGLAGVAYDLVISKVQLWLDKTL